MCAVDGDDAVLVPVALDDHGRSGLDQEEVVVGVALAEQHLPRLDGADHAGRAQPGALVWAEPRKRAVPILGLFDARPQRLVEGGPECLGHQSPSITNIASST